jgi:UDP-N-acetylmuramoyl-tripeptide--D-alanyl-D-alanine ligase
MIQANVYDIQAVINAEVKGVDAAICGAVIDARQAQGGALFFAFKGERVDGHDFVQQAKDNGASAAVVECFVDVDLPQLKVSSSRLALGQLANWWRHQLDCKIVALTGSNGKTTVKEMMAAILENMGKTSFTQGNLNNDLGMPLTLLSVDKDQDYAVLEMGANHFGEIEYLTHIAKPDVALVNNAGPAHLEGFGDIAGVAREKGQIYNGLTPGGVAVINVDDRYADYWRSVCADKTMHTFSLDDRPTHIQGKWDKAKGLLSIFDGNDTIDVRLNLLGDHNAHNALAAATTTLAAGANLASVKKGLESVAAVAGRLKLLTLADDFSIIDDTYNANPASLMAGVDVAVDLAKAKGVQAWFAMGDLGELGDDCEDIHRSLGEEIRQKGVDRLFTLGEYSKLTVDAYGDGAQGFNAFEDLLAAIHAEKQNTKGVVLLVKGSRTSRMERVVNGLVEKA